MKLKDNYCVEHVAGQQVLLPAGKAVIDSGMVYHLNESGAWALETLGQEMDFDTLLARAAAHFQAQNDSERETLRGDLTAFIGQVRALGLLEE